MTGPNKSINVAKKQQKTVLTVSKQFLVREIESSLTNDSIIKMYSPDRPTMLTTDASKAGIGGVLEQEINGKIYVIEYFSRTLKPPERNYGPSELECLALLEACRHFKHYLLGINFTVITDHHSLCWLTKLNNPSGRLARWSIALGEFNFEVKYKKRQRKLECRSSLKIS